MIGSMWLQSFESSNAVIVECHGTPCSKIELGKDQTKSGAFPYLTFMPSIFCHFFAQQIWFARKCSAEKIRSLALPQTCLRKLCDREWKRRGKKIQPTPGFEPTASRSWGKFCLFPSNFPSSKKPLKAGVKLLPNIWSLKCLISKLYWPLSLTFCPSVPKLQHC